MASRDDIIENILELARTHKITTEGKDVHQILREIEDKTISLTEKGKRIISEADWRGSIALIFCLGTITIAIISLALSNLEGFTTVMAVLGPLVTIIIKDYFQSKEPT